MYFYRLSCMQIAEEENWFDMADIVDGIASKMVSRHPHIFGDASVTTSEEVLDQWGSH